MHVPVTSSNRYRCGI